jgi:dihydroneopterin aldolase
MDKTLLERMTDAIQRDLRFAVDMQMLLETLKLRDTVQYDIAQARIKELRQLVGEAKVQRDATTP